MNDDTPRNNTSTPRTDDRWNTLRVSGRWNSLLTMNIEDQRIALAELDGWTKVFKNAIFERDVMGIPPGNTSIRVVIPPPDDLNWLHRVLLSLTDDEKQEVVWQLNHNHPTLDIFSVDPSERNYNRMLRTEAVGLITAEPARIREAILRATGRWNSR